MLADIVVANSTFPGSYGSPEGKKERLFVCIIFSKVKDGSFGFGPEMTDGNFLHPILLNSPPLSIIYIFFALIDGVVKVFLSYVIFLKLL